tara:strand:+ start:366 stop:638 length:273 start_codon:yes stop_codon:yes gene_type:complete
MTDLTVNRKHILLWVADKAPTAGRSDRELKNLRQRGLVTVRPTRLPGRWPKGVWTITDAGSVIAEGFRTTLTERGRCAARGCLGHTVANS